MSVALINKNLKRYVLVNRKTYNKVHYTYRNSSASLLIHVPEYINISDDINI